MMRVDVCNAEDHASQDRLQRALAMLGYLPDDSWHDGPLGVGVTRYRRQTVELTVFKDAWLVDLAGPGAAVEAVLALLQTDEFTYQTNPHTD